ncbi:TlpA family protein disulfide reductase [Facklamia miroungae]|uniref:Thiol-disulfide isomerase or thioredoxin n=1 Tax=Facklamia miroungae TaxID=120956 RepID=A0A1G7QNW5_9LACT|nr:TlpA disulfide reductase family protein [Facklamia miroungae]NKZ29012.1 TlpA family protein disulfide reductase [Facklamia miroungae]SDG00174.1 Thiol-disulfide isomerase or thioredoxin [Facklamia miroungae]
MKKLLTYGLLLVAVIGLGAFVYNQVHDQPLSLNQSTSDPKTVDDSIITTEELKTEDEEKKTKLSQKTSQEKNVTMTTLEEEKDPFKHLDVESVLIKDQTEKTIQLSENFGRPMVINVWATWCPPCRKEMPYFQRAWEQYQGDIDFYMINATHSKPGETSEAVNEYVAELDLNLPIYFDVNFSTMLALQATFLPTTIFINADGEVVHHQLGLMGEDQLLEKIEELL